MGNSSGNYQHFLEQEDMQFLSEKSKRKMNALFLFKKLLNKVHFSCNIPDHLFFKQYK